MIEAKKANARVDNDGAWKEILGTHLKDFVEFFWPEAYKDIDWSKKYEFLEQEFLQISISDASGKRNLDKLCKVYLLSGEEQWILLHIEVQHTSEDDFPKRMFVYFYRIFDRYDQKIASLAVLADANHSWRPDCYREKIWGSEITRTYEVIKLIDFESRVEELRTHQNPFALVVLVQLAALKTKKDQKRLMTKLEFFRALYQQNRPREECMSLYRFLDLIFVLKPQSEIQYIQEAKKIEEEFNMNLTLTAERHGFTQGVEQGMQQGEAQLLASILTAKFHDIPVEYLKKIETADVGFLNKWAINALTAPSLPQVFKD